MTNKTTFNSTLATEIAAKCMSRYNDNEVRYENLKDTPITSVEAAAETAVAMAEIKAVAKLYRTFSSIARWFIKADLTFAEVRLGMMSELIDLATEGADDRWSGRGNDLARSAHDACLKEIRKIQSMINAG